jgi:hypothetical protein
MRRPSVRVLGTAAVAASVVAAAYPILSRRWFLHWGATMDEVTATLPGDELMPYPDIQTTRAVTIGARPEAVWPWLVQMGSGRGGAYSHDWVENLLGQDTTPSAGEIRPDLQGLATGDLLPLGKRGPRMRVEILRPNEVLAVRSVYGDWVWLFVLRPERDEASTRLVSRNLITTPHASWPRRALSRFIVEPGSLVMERRMLLGIKQRVERLTSARGTRT